MTPTPSQLLASSPVHSLNAVAKILALTKRNGDPNRRAVRELIHSGRLRLVDPDQPISRWTVSAAEIERYIAGPPMVEATTYSDRHPVYVRGAS